MTDLPPQETTQSQETIVITEPRLPDAESDRAYAIVTIDAARLTANVRLDEALREVPGVATFRRNGSAAANPTIQGLSLRAIAPSGAGRTLVLLDGVPLNDPFGGWVIWGQAPPETIARADIIRGAGAGAYGAGALTGAVRLDEIQNQGVIADAEIGDRDSARFATFAEAGSGALSWLVGASAQRDDGWIPVHEGRGAADDRARFEGASELARLQWRGDEHIASLRLSAYGEERGAGLVGASSDSSGSLLSFTLAKPYGASAWRVQAWAHRSNLANTSVAVASDRSATTPANDQYSTPALGLGANAAVRFGGDNANLELGADIRSADGETREHFAFSNGAFTRMRVAGGRTLIAGVYAEAWKSWQDWLVSGGVRVDQYRAFDGERRETLLATGAETLSATSADSDTLTPTARFALRRDMGDTFWRAAAYTGFRPPTLNELHRPFRVGNDVTEANAELKPERLFGIDAGFGGESEYLTWNAGLFFNRLEDPIVNVTLGQGPGTFPPGVFVPAGGAYRQRQNQGRIDAAGFEGDANGALSETIDWRAALTYTHARVDSGDLRPAQAPEWSANAGLVWRAAPSTNFTIDLTYESARFEDDLNTRKLAPALNVDLGADVELRPGLQLFAALDNAGGAAIETAETADGITSLGAPQTWRFGLRYRTSS